MRNNNANKGNTMTNQQEARIVKLQDEQRKAENAGNMMKADRLQAQIERLYYNYNR